MKQKKVGKYVIIVVVVMLFVVAAVVYGVYTSGKTDGSQSDATPLQEELTGYELDTPVGILYYPAEWADYVDVSQKTEGNTYVADFYSKLASQNVHIFSLYIGDEGRGFLMGQMGDRSVWVNVVSGAENPEWTEEESEQISSMRTRVNDIMDQIYNLEGFVKSQPET